MTADFVKFGHLVEGQHPDSAGELPHPPPPPRRVRLATARDVRREMVAVYADSRAGAIPPATGSRLCFMLDMVRRSIESMEIETRLAEVERQLSGGV